MPSFVGLSRTSSCLLLRQAQGLRLLWPYAPTRFGICRRVFGDVGRVGSVAVHQVDLFVAVPIAHEGDHGPIRRNHWGEIFRRVVGELGLADEALGRLADL